MNIRVWRSLVSRLNGVQEASSSNLDTRTMKTERAFALSVFIISRRDSNDQMQLIITRLLAAVKQPHYENLQNEHKQMNNAPIFEHCHLI